MVCVSAGNRSAELCADMMPWSILSESETRDICEDAILAHSSSQSRD